LWSDPELRSVCTIEEDEKPYHPSQLTRFRERIGPERLEQIMNALLTRLMEGSMLVGETVVFDATFASKSLQ
jgi:hypothetical protein